MIRESKALTLVWTDIPDGMEAEFNDWYNREHMVDRIVKVPGFLSGRRFVANHHGSHPKYLALYSTTGLAVFSSEKYLQLQRMPDEKSRHFIPEFRNTVKGFFKVASEAGFGEGAHIALLELKLSDKEFAEFQAILCSAVYPNFLSCAGFVSSTLGTADQSISQNVSTQVIRKGDRYLDGLLIIEATHVQALKSAIAYLDVTALATRGLMLDKEPVLFSQMISLHALT
jgi:hypothetical protein